MTRNGSYYYCLTGGYPLVMDTTMYKNLHRAPQVGS
jgi:hypothetical protein